MSWRENKLKVRADATTTLCAVRAKPLVGSVRLGIANTQLSWWGPGSATWEVDVLEEGEYEVALCYTAMVGGSCFEVVSSDSLIRGSVRPTQGYFTTPSRNQYEGNFERVFLDDKLYLRKGINQITLRVTKAAEENTMRLWSLELTPVAVKATVASREEEAKKLRASTDWLVEAGYGVMFHWTSHSQPRYGRQKPYRDAVRDFDVKAFADTVEQTGAGYVLFTVNHADPTCPAPIKSWEELHPGWTTQRDLIGEIADALERRNIRLMLYINSPGLGKMNERDRGYIDVGRLTEDDMMEEYIDNNCRVLTEIGERYGSAISGYWFDSWYQAYERFGNVPVERVYKATKAGNPDRISAFNFWIFPVCTPYQDYWTGEVGSPGIVPVGRYLDDRTYKGLQFHALLIMDDPWVHGKPDTEVEHPHYTAEELGEYIKACMKNQGVVTINLGIYQDGRIGEKTLEVMKGVKRIVRG